MGSPRKASLDQAIRGVLHRPFEPARLIGQSAETASRPDFTWKGTPFPETWHSISQTLALKECDRDERQLLADPTIGHILERQTAMSENEEVAVRKVISDFADAWNLHDARAMAELHTDDVNFVNIFGQWWNGRGEVEQGLHRGHMTAFSKSRMLVSTELVKFLASEIVLVHGTMELQDAPPETLGRCHSSRVLVKENGRWLISSFQNTLICTGDPAAPKK